MKSILHPLIAICVAMLLPSFSLKADEDPCKIASSLAHRVIGDAADGIVFHLESDTCDVFRICMEDGKVAISGNSANSMAAGLNHYLRFFCNVNIGWFAWEKPSSPVLLADVDKEIRIKARVRNRFFLNYCTFGYSMPWWHWEEWEHFIDWMALSGINLPLAITGQESIWYKVWTELGVDEKKVREYFTGPAHLPWHRMLNIDRWGGPLPVSWLNSQAELQRKIVARERELGMKPVLPAFSGHVPEALLEVYPHAKITKMGSWCGFPEEDVPCFLDPMDSLFPQIQEKFLSVQKDIYGTDHIYGIDLFNEMDPPSGDPEYLGRVSRQVYQALSQADPDAVWLQMTWLFWNERDFWTNDRVKPYICSYPADKSLLLDYYCERQEIWQRTEKYFGVPYIWCYLGNFGGNTYLAGDFAEVGKRIENTFENGGDNFCGIGATLEGLDCNPFMYQYVLDKAWDFPLHKDREAYSRMLSDSRTGRADPMARKAWGILLDSIYVDRTVPGHSPLMNLRPSLGRSSSYHSSVRFTYDNGLLLEAARLLLSSGGEGPSYEFDVVNLTRQWLSNLFDGVLAQYRKAYEEKNQEKCKELAEKMLCMLDDMDALLSTNTCFLLGKWISDARGWGADSAEADFFEKNARNLLSSWGDGGNLLTDYANRTWAGLVSSYYKPRWEMFLSEAQSSLEKGSPLDEDALKQRMIAFEKEWWDSPKESFPSKAEGDFRKEASRIIAKYALE